MEMEHESYLDLHQVWHAVNPVFGLAYQGLVPMPVWPHEYDWVAGVVLAPDIDAVYRVTQTPWNDDRIIRGSDQVRSTSVGDVVVTPNRTAFRCAPYGWDCLGRVK